VFDGQDGSAQRKEADAGCKANRPADDEALKPIRALPSVKAGLDLFPITWVEITNTEADDVIATLAASCPERDVLIASVDQDYYQLLRDAGPGHGSVQVLSTARRAGSRLAGQPRYGTGTASRQPSSPTTGRLSGAGRSTCG
jgi:DNA polymerase I